MPVGKWQSWLSIPPLKGKEYCAEKGTTRSARGGSISAAPAGSVQNRKRTWAASASRKDGQGKFSICAFLMASLPACMPATEPCSPPDNRPTWMVAHWVELPHLIAK